jgi:hypothetical protein
MKTIKRLFSLMMILFSAIFLFGCTNPNGGEQPEQPEEPEFLSPETFDAYAHEIAVLYIEGDEMSINYLFVNPEDYGFEHYEPTLPVPSTVWNCIYKDRGIEYP